MPDIVIPEEKFEEFLRSLLVKVTQIREELIAEAVADVELFRAKINAGYERKVREAEEKAEERIERMIRAMEEDLERKARATDEELERKMRAAEDQIEIKLREAADEIARLRQAERLRHAAAAERGERPQ